MCKHSPTQARTGTFVPPASGDPQSNRRLVQGQGCGHLYYIAHMLSAAAARPLPKHGPVSGQNFAHLRWRRLRAAASGWASRCGQAQVWQRLLCCVSACPALAAPLQRARPCPSVAAPLAQPTPPAAPAAPPVAAGAHVGQPDQPPSPQAAPGTTAPQPPTASGSPAVGPVPVDDAQPELAGGTADEPPEEPAAPATEAVSPEEASLATADKPEDASGSTGVAVIPGLPAAPAVTVNRRGRGSAAWTLATP